MSSADVVITGVGCVSPLAVGREETWTRLLAGGRAVRWLDEEDFHGLPLEQGGFPRVGAPAARGAAADLRRDPVVNLIETAADEAAAEAGLVRGAFDPTRAACVIGTSKGEIVSFAKSFGGRSGGDWIPFSVSAAAASVGRRLGLQGARLAPVAACATGLVSVLRAAELIRAGTCDVAVAGSGDASLHPAVLASFCRLGVLATRFEEAAAACRPFNADRDGFAVGEGAAVFVLERRGHAQGRGASPLVTFLGGALLSDPSGLTSVDPEGAALARAVAETLKLSGLAPPEIGHVNLHGTATRLNDAAESAALRASLGRHAESVPCVALKGAIGHLLGAAGAVELAATALSVRDGLLPPTINLTEPDRACLPCLSRESARVGEFGLKISLGFGGHVTAACLGPP